MAEFISVFNEFGKSIFDNLNKCFIRKSIHPNGCGSYLISGSDFNYDKTSLSKQNILYNYSKNKKNGLEIGVHMGHSLLICYLSNPFINFDTIDINDYSIHAIDFLNNAFDNRIKYLNGDSLIEMTKLNKKYDFVHIDGNHTYEYVKKELDYIYEHLVDNAIVIVDDYCNDLSPESIYSAVNDCVKENKYRILEVSKNDNIYNNVVLMKI